VRRESEALPIVLVAAVLLGLGLTDTHLLYVKPAMQPWLVAAGTFVAMLAVARYFIVPADDGPADDGPADAGPADGEHDDTAHDDPRLGHDHHEGHPGRWLPWLLALPFLAVVLVTPKPLGAYLAARETPRVPTPSADDFEYPPLPRAVDGAHELTLMEFTERALYDDQRQLEEATVRLTGFVTPAPDGEEGFLLTRFVIACCAGDGTPIQVAVRGPGDAAAPPADTWLEVEGTWQPDPSGDEPDIPVLAAQSLREVPQPADPYER
jgi:uncharacterized repeat protein (TIGR03943 family)